MKNRLSIRSAGQNDLPGIQKLLSVYSLPTQRLEDQFGESYCIAELDSSIVGVAGIEIYGHYGLLRSVADDQSFQGKSIGKSLVNDRLKWAKSSAITEVYLLTIDADRYFERFGFRAIKREAVPDEIKQSSEFASICPKSAIVMVKHLR